MRSIEVAVAYVGGQWESMWIEVRKPEEEGLKDEELGERAEELALKLAAKLNRQVSFTKVLYIGDPDDQGFSG